MKKMIGVILILLFASVSLGSETPTLERKKSTAVSFDDLLVQGKYQLADEMVTTVEDDKVLDALLSVRKDFRDRVKRSAAKH